MKNIFQFVRRIPFTLLMLIALFIGGLVTNTNFQQITHRWLRLTGFAANDLWYGRLERLFSSALVTMGGVVFWEAIFFVAFAVGLAEWMTSWKRAALTFWGVHILALLLLSEIISTWGVQLRTIGLDSSLVRRDVGPSAGYLACLGLVSARLKSPWHWVSGGILVLFLAFMLFLPHGAGQSAQLKFSADLAHLLAFPLGWLTAWVGSKKRDV
jgi:hypothetical protein